MKNKTIVWTKELAVKVLKQHGIGQSVIEKEFSNEDDLIVAARAITTQLTDADLAETSRFKLTDGTVDVARAIEAAKKAASTREAIKKAKEDLDALENGD